MAGNWRAAAFIAYMGGAHHDKMGWVALLEFLEWGDILLHRLVLAFFLHWWWWQDEHGMHGWQYMEGVNICFDNNTQYIDLYSFHPIFFAYCLCLCSVGCWMEGKGVGEVCPDFTLSYFGGGFVFLLRGFSNTLTYFILLPLFSPIFYLYLSSSSFTSISHLCYQHTNQPTNEPLSSRSRLNRSKNLYFMVFHLHVTSRVGLALVSERNDIDIWISFFILRWGLVVVYPPSRKAWRRGKTWWEGMKVIYIYTRDSFG